MAKPKHKSMRNQPEMYNETKRPFTFSLTPTAVNILDFIAKIHGISRSEIVEQYARTQDHLQLICQPKLTLSSQPKLFDNPAVF